MAQAHNNPINSEVQQLISNLLERFNLGINHILTKKHFLEVRDTESKHKHSYDERTLDLVNTFLFTGKKLEEMVSSKKLILDAEGIKIFKQMAKLLRGFGRFEDEKNLNKFLEVLEICPVLKMITGCDAMHTDAGVQIQIKSMDEFKKVEPLLHKLQIRGLLKYNMVQPVGGPDYFMVTHYKLDLADALKHLPIQPTRFFEEKLTEAQQLISNLLERFNLGINHILTKKHFLEVRDTESKHKHSYDERTLDLVNTFLFTGEELQKMADSKIHILNSEGIKIFKHMAELLRGFDLFEDEKKLNNLIKILEVSPAYQNKFRAT